MLRSKVKQTQVDLAEKMNNPDLLEAPFTILVNDAFHKVSEKVRSELGALDSKRIFFEWNDWITRSIKKKQFLIQ